MLTCFLFLPLVAGLGSDGGVILHKDTPMFGPPLGFIKGVSGRNVRPSAEGTKKDETDTASPLCSGREAAGTKDLTDRQTDEQKQFDTSTGAAGKELSEPSARFPNSSRRWKRTEASRAVVSG